MKPLPPIRPAWRLAAVALCAAVGGGVGLFLITVQRPDAVTAAPVAVGKSFELPSAAPAGPPAVKARASPGPALLDSGLARLANLADSGQFAAAAEFAATAENSDRRIAWTTEVFSRWSAVLPREAATAALSRPDATLRGVAWLAVVSSWARSQPAALADYAFALPPGESRRLAMGEAVRHWAARDPAAAAVWTSRIISTPDSDPALVGIATAPSLATRQPAVALGWAEVIVDPALRSRTVGSVVREWATVDRAAATQYARNSPALLPSEREDVLVGERFTPHP